MHRVMFSPKTESGKRSIPMMDEVREALLAEKERQERVGTANTVIDGMSGWVFTNRYGTVFTPKSINAAIARICRAYNQQEAELAAQEGRKAILLPHFTCHHLRHTFCTRLVEIEPNAKLVQAIMGHADISTTMDIYADVEERMKRESKVRVQGKLFIR